MRKLLLFIILSTIVISDHAIAQAITVIQLENRPSEEIIPILMPMLEQGGALSGTGYKLIVKASPENTALIKNLVQEIDQAQRQLKISVISADSYEHFQQILRATIDAEKQDKVKISIGKQQKDTLARNEISLGSENAKITAQGRNAKNNHVVSNAQHTQVSEGHWATIHAGQAFPVRERRSNADGTVTETIRYYNVNTGFEVLPRINGEQVILEVRSFSHNPNKRTTTINSQHIDTRITTKLGKWINLGGAKESTSHNRDGVLSSNNQRKTTANQIWLKVELM